MVGITSGDQSLASDVEQSDNTHSGFGGKLHSLGEKLKGTGFHDFKIKATHIKHRIGKLENLINTNHRHDEEHEKRTDAKRTQIGESHRFQSFAPERDGNLCKWYIDGRDYFHALSIALERAKETIYIADWWLSPELFLRRPPVANQEWRLDQVLKRAAQRGVKIYVSLYREVEAAITCNSLHSKHALEALCAKDSPGYGNIRVMRHPDHNMFANGADMTFYWAHHEKFVVIDYDMAFIGGLDLCFGRWDTNAHTLACVHPGGIQYEIWPGQDFNNNRVADFKNVDDWRQNEVSKAHTGRMPWHDIHMGLIGPCIYDIAEHFVLRWNFIKRDKYKRDDEYDWLTLTGRTGDDEDLIGVQRPKHPVGDYIHHPLSPLEHKKGNPAQSTHNGGHHDAHDEPSNDSLRPPEDIDEHGYTSDQHRRGHGLQKEFRQYSQRHNLPHLHHDDENDKPEHAVRHQDNPKHTGNDASKEGMVSASGGIAEKSKGYNSDMVTQGQQTAQGSVHAQIVRSSADWSMGILTEQSIQTAYCQVIREAKHYVYIENQFFITATGTKQGPVHNQIGAAIADACISAGKEGRKFRIIIVIPCIPGFAGDLRDDAATGTRAIMDYQYKAICRGPESIFGKIRAAGVDPEQHIFFFNLRSYDRINFTPQLKECEEKSGVKYSEVQRAHAEEVMDTGLHHTNTDSSHDDVKVGKRAEQERRDVVARREKFEAARSADDIERLKKMSGDPRTASIGQCPFSGSRDTIAGDAMLGDMKPSDEPWAGRNSDDPDADAHRESEVQHFIQEELYIHSKLVIADDRIVICGSSNINDRSQLGFHDSEISIVMEDTRPMQIKMDGQPFTAGHHAATLRRMLWREHLGLLPPQPIAADNDPNALPPGDAESDYHQGDEWDALMTDPMSDELWSTWTSRADVNTKVFRHLFHADPDDAIRTFEDYENFVGKQGSRKAGHLYDMYAPADVVRRELDKIKGHVVWMPLHFLEDADMAERGLALNSITESVYT